MDRLLSEQEIELITRIAGSGYRAWTDIAKAQLAKTDKEWVEWAETTLRACTTRTCKYHDKDCLYLRDILCGAWQARKKEIGI